MIQKNNSKCFSLLLARELTHLKCMEDPCCETGSARSSENLQMAEDLNLGKLFIFASFPSMSFHGLRLRLLSDCDSLVLRPYAVCKMDRKAVISSVFKSI